MKIVNRKDIKAKEFPEYYLIFKTEKHHKHEIIRDEQGVLRWRANEDVRRMVDKIGLNDLCALWQYMGLTKNSEFVRKLYRDIGYSLSGYWEVFYWEMNNENASEYVPNKE